jgi:PHD/YefM family antitoxin component YafN of YafNO toxin-antitoxin module
MTQILVDAEMAKKIEQADGPVHVVNHQGTLIAVCTPVKFPHSPYSREEIERVREEVRSHPERARPLAEFWAEFLKQQGEQP